MPSAAELMALGQYAGGPQQGRGRQLMELLGQTWPARAAQAMLRHPGNVYAGLADAGDVGAALDVAGGAMTGGIAGAPKGALGSGPYRVDMYHGTGRPFQEIDLGQAGSRASFDQGYLGKGFYGSSDPSEASIYAGQTGSVYPLKAKMENPLVLNETTREGRSIDRAVAVREALGLSNKASADDVTRALLEKGYDGVAYNWNRFGTSTEYMVPDAAQIRSRYAKFDPANEGKAMLLGSGVGPGAVLPVSIQERR
jgi:hypothetical protein